MKIGIISTNPPHGHWYDRHRWSVYYLGGETDGRMKTGWVKLEENASSPGASESWHYFNSDGGW